MGHETGERATGRTSTGTSKRRRPHRWRRTVLAALISAAVVLPLSAATRPDIPAPPPATLAPLTPATLDAAYRANRADAARAARMAEAHGDRSRATADRTLAASSRHLLQFDGRGAGEATEVLGDLAHADHIAVLVPGSDTSLDTYARFHSAASALYQRLLQEQPTAPRTAVAVVAWLGYRTPGTVSPSVLTTGRADQAARHLREALRDLRRVGGDRPGVSLLCHSYGSVVCARAAAGLDALGVTDLVLVGSPGTGTGSAAALHTRARVWAGRGAGDWVGDVPHIRSRLFGFFGPTVGFGTDPVSPAFGAHVFAAGPGGHSDYFTPGSTSLTNLARIVLGDTKEVTHA